VLRVVLEILTFCFVLFFEFYRKLLVESFAGISALLRVECS